MRHIKSPSAKHQLMCPPFLSSPTASRSSLHGVQRKQPTRSFRRGSREGDIVQDATHSFDSFIVFNLTGYRGFAPAFQYEFGRGLSVATSSPA